MKIVVKGVGITPFGELWNEDVPSLTRTATMTALIDAGLELEDIDALVVGNMLLPYVSNQSHVGAAIAEALSYAGPSIAIEAACASGGVAVRQAMALLYSKMAKRVLVVGVEKMTDVSSGEVTGFLMGASSEEERMMGATFPSLYAMMQQRYQVEFGCSEEEIASAAVASHFHGSLNPKAHFQAAITTAQVLSSPLVSDPIHLLSCSPVSDGAAAVILEAVNVPSRDSIVVLGSGQGHDALSLSGRQTLTSMNATKNAMKQALQQSCVSADLINIVELHDCFSIAEIIALEDLGLVARGRGAKFLADGYGRYDSDGVAINTSGGLKACGHPVGATGIKQVVEIVDQLRGRAGKRQVVNALFGLTHNVGGTGATAVVHILGRWK